MENNRNSQFSTAQLRDANFFRQLAKVYMQGYTDPELYNDSIRMDAVSIVLDDAEKTEFEAILRDTHEFLDGKKALGITNSTIIQRMFALYLPDHAFSDFNLDQFQASITVRYWQIECTRHMKTLFKTKIEATHISEKKLEELITILLCKYALSDEEIVEQCLQQHPKKGNYVNIQRNDSQVSQHLDITFTAQSADTSVVARLTD